MYETFTDKERDILRLVQDSLPYSLSPYADIAEKVGVSEDDVLALLCRLKEEGVIRRFGASIKHQKAGYAHNAMVAWSVSEEEADKAGEAAASHAQVSHCYYRPSPASDWPYELYTMIHGRTEEECKKHIEEVRALTGLQDCMIVKSVKEYKKSSMKYF